MTVHEPASRLLIIGIDGGTWDILGPLCDLGEMPNLARLRAHSAWAELQSTQPPFTAPAWTTFATGVNPGQHGVLNFIRKPEDPARSLRNEGAPVNHSHILAPTLWDYLYHAERQVGIMNLPLSYPLRPVFEFAVSGMLTPPGAKDWTIPPTLAAELKDYVVELDYDRPGGSGNAATPSPAQMLDDITRMTERRGFHALRLMQKRPWDVFMVVFTGTDRISHHFWHYLQPGGPDDASGIELYVARMLKSYFNLLDSILGSLTRAAGSDANIVLLSDHGFGPAARNWAHLNNWLLELDLLRLHANAGGVMHRLKRRAPWLRDVAKRILPKEARDAVQQAGHLAAAIDWPNTLAWAEPIYNNVAGITLHRADRFSEGAVSPANTMPLRERLIEEARRLRIPGTKQPLIIDIQHRENLYQGPYTERFPDLIVTLDPDYAAVPTLGSSLITPILQLPRTGDHRPDGIFLVAGPNVQPGRLHDKPHLIDLAPTLLHLADTLIPTDMEGRVLTEVFDDGYLVLHPPRQCVPLPPPESAARIFSSLDDRAVRERLRGLGYLDD